MCCYHYFWAGLVSPSNLSCWKLILPTLLLPLLALGKAILRPCVTNWHSFRLSPTYTCPVFPCASAYSALRRVRERPPSSCLVAVSKLLVYRHVIGLLVSFLHAQQFPSYSRKLMLINFFLCKHWPFAGKPIFSLPSQPHLYGASPSLMKSHSLPLRFLFYTEARIGSFCLPGLQGCSVFPTRRWAVLLHSSARIFCLFTPKGTLRPFKWVYQKAYKQQKFISHSSQGWEIEGWLSSEDPVFITILLHPHMGYDK